MTFRPVPKPVAKTDHEKRVEKIVKAWGRQRQWQQKSVERSKGKLRTKMKAINPRATKRRHDRYMKLIRSDFNLRLRYERYVIANGYCECEPCAGWRHHTQSHVLTAWSESEMQLAWRKPEVWFTKGGSAPHKRFRSTEGQLHHLPRGYTLTERESPDAINYVRWMHKVCHARIEAENPTRRRFLKGK